MDLVLVVSRTFALFAVIPLLSSVVFLRAVGQARIVGSNFSAVHSESERKEIHVRNVTDYLLARKDR